MSTITQFPSGNTQYRIEFDYLARTFVIVTLVNSSNPTINRVLEAGRDYRFLNPTMIEMLVDQSGFDIVRIHRQTGTDLVVDFRNGSVLTASDLTNAELQAIHIAEEGRDQTVDLAKEYADAAGDYAGNAKDSEDEARRIAESIKEAGRIGYITRRSFEKGFNVTTWNEVLLWEEDGDYYRWDGTLPKNVPAGSTPESTGGIGSGAWLSVGDAALRNEINAKLSEGAFPADTKYKYGLPSVVDGAVFRNAQEKFDDFVSVRDFGAIGDGSTDDSVAFQKAINTGRAVMVPAGIYRVQNVSAPKVVLFAEVPGSVEIQPVNPAGADPSACLYIRGASKTNLSAQNYIGGITFSSPFAAEGETPFLLFCEFIEYSTFENLLFYRGTFYLYNHKYINFYNSRLYGGQLLANQNKADVDFEAAVGLHIDRLYAAFTSKVEIRNSTDTRITNTFITNPGLALLVEFDTDFFNSGGSKPFCGVLKTSNIIVEGRSVLRCLALSTITSSWFGAFSGTGVKFEDCYGLAFTGSTSHYCNSGSAMELNRVYDSSFVSSSFTNASNDGVTMDNCTNIQFVGCNVGTFELYE